MFSILVSELTAELLKKAEYWKIYGVSYKGEQWSDVRHRNRLDTYVDESGRTIFVYWGGVQALSYDPCCFPVTMTPDGTETRLECPRLSDEVEIEWYPKPSPGVQYNAIGAAQTPNGAKHWRLESQTIPFTSTATQMAPTPDHYPRRTCDGVWVWSTRR